MSLEMYLAFLGATILLLISPGPTVMLVVGYGLKHGRRTVWATSLGAGLGDATALTCSLLGLGAVLAASATAFTVLKWAGALYLIYLGVKMWRGQPGGQEGREHFKSRPLKIVGHAFAVTALNPKSIAFFVAFLPQFLDHSAPLSPQLLSMGVTFVTLAVLNAMSYGLLAGALGQTFQRPRAKKVLDRFGGSCLIGAGLLTASLRRG